MANGVLDGLFVKGGSKKTWSYLVIYKIVMKEIFVCMEEIFMLFYPTTQLYYLAASILGWTPTKSSKKSLTKTRT